MQGFMKKRPVGVLPKQDKSKNLRRHRVKEGFL